MHCVHTHTQTHRERKRDKLSLVSSIPKDLHCGGFKNWSLKIMTYGTFNSRLVEVRVFCSRRFQFHVF